MNVSTEFKSYLYIRKALKYIKIARKLLHKDIGLSIAYKELSLEYEKRAKEIQGGK